MSDGKTELISEKPFTKYIKLVCIALLVVIEIVICAQAATTAKDAASMRGQTGIVLLAATAACCLALTIVETVQAFFIKRFAAKMVFYGLDSALLLAISAMTGNFFLSTLYCIVLTQYYITVDKFKDRTILYGTGCGFYIVSFVVGWVIVNKGVAIVNSIVEILSGCILGLFILTAHYVIANFLIKFYHTNVELRAALAEADRSKEELKEVYEQLNRTAVYEERNRIAKDIHDNTGHAMTTVIMQTEAAKLLIDTDPAEAKNRIISANMQARDALERMRESVHLLAGRAHGNTLKEELDEIIARTIDGTDLKIRSDIEDLDVGEEMQRYIANTVKEALANGVRHGKASAFYVEVKKSFGAVTVLISDNGCGSDEIKEGFGLRGVREKAESFGGSCTFSTYRGEGFEMQITLPMEDDKNDKNTAG